jgi:mono/diheme cytochrome c family protein
LNGTAHAWHHPLGVLKKVINEGGIPMGGKMPAFNDKLKDDEKLAVISYFQSFWPDEIYNAWISRGGLN